ncbi:MAG TPA: hypothetical protein VK869_04115 [Rubrobacteraceae bacterium]|nr:hypothetical protein [Rubrobacteraceae bacterium]
MNARSRAFAGALSGLAGTFVLTGLRRALTAADIIDTSAPEQVVRRVEELGLLEGWSSGARKALVVAAHFGYGVGTGAVFGALRHEDIGPEDELVKKLRGNREDPVTEATVGAALGILSWGAGWAGWLPVAGVHPAPWTQKTPRALLPVLDHAAYGAAWGITYWVLTRKLENARQ